MSPKTGWPAVLRSGAVRIERSAIVFPGLGNVRCAEGMLPFDGPPRDEVMRVARHASGGN
jgi:hypothetical protein